MVSTDHKIAGYLYPIAGRKTLTTSEILPSEFWRGITEFNQGEFYACHDTLEAIWMEAGEPEKTFYQGILQMAVALYHLGNRNVRGAIILLGEGMHRLRRYESDYGGSMSIGCFRKADRYKQPSSRWNSPARIPIQ